MPLLETPLAIDRDPMKRLPRIDISGRVMDVLEVRPCTLREISIFGRGYIPGTSFINIASRYESGSYQNFSVNNLELEAYDFLMGQLAQVFRCSPEELKRIGCLCYNVRRGFGSLSDVPSLPFQIAKIPNDKICSIGNTEGDLWISSAA